MNEFLLFMNDLRQRWPFHLKIFYSKIMDWCITVTKDGCAAQYSDAQIIRGADVLVCQEQDLDMELCFAKAHVAVKEWLREHEGGY